MNYNLISLHSCKSYSVKYLSIFIFALCTTVLFSSNAMSQNFDCSTLDNFQNSSEIGIPVTLTFMDPGPLNIVDNGSAGVLGTFRNVTFGPLNGDVSILIIDNGILNLSNAINSTAPVSILYSGNGSGLGLELSDSSSIEITLNNNDLPDTSASVILTDSENNSANSFIANLPNIIDGDELPTDIRLPLSEFSGIDNIDISDIQSIELILDPAETSADTILSNIDVCGPPIKRPIPTLSQWGLIAIAGVLGIIGLFAVKRKKALA